MSKEGRMGGRLIPLGDRLTRLEAAINCKIELELLFEGRTWCSERLPKRYLIYRIIRSMRKDEH